MYASIMPRSKFLTLAFAADKQKAVFELLVSALRHVPSKVVHVALFLETLPSRKMVHKQKLLESLLSFHCHFTARAHHILLLVSNAVKQSFSCIYQSS